MVGNVRDVKSAAVAGKWVPWSLRYTFKLKLPAIGFPRHVSLRPRAAGPIAQARHHP
jgi:hypothetical protein